MGIQIFMSTRVLHLPAKALCLSKARLRIAFGPHKISERIPTSRPHDQIVTRKFLVADGLICQT